MNSNDALLKSAQFDRLASELAGIGRFFAERGWSPAMSSNYSAKIDNDTIAISRTGVDKFVMTPQDVIVIDRAGAVLAPAGARSSDETLIHTSIYNETGAAAALHTHSPENTRLSLKFATLGEISFEGYEMQKGLAGNKTHETKTIVPILPNAQDMTAYAKVVSQLLRERKNIHGFLIAGHGLYTWGADLKTTKRQVETFEFLFRCRTLELMGV